MMSSIAHIVRSGFNRAQRAVDPNFDSGGLTVLGGSGLGTSSVTGGVLSIISTTNAYFARNPLLLEPGSYSVSFTILNYVSGAISISCSANTDMSSSTDGTTRSANGTFTESLTLTAPGYIGLKGQGAAIVNALQVDNLSITRVA